MTYQNPLTQPLFIFIKRQVRMLCGSFYGCIATEGAYGIDKHVRAQRDSTSFTLVAECMLKTTIRAGAFDKSVRQKSFCFLVIILFAVNQFEFTPVIEISKKFLGGFVMKGITCPVINIK